MVDYMEKRDFQRMEMGCYAEIQLNGSGKVDSAIVKDLSSGGVLLGMDRQVEPGSQFSLIVKPGKDITPPLRAKVEVQRCFPTDESEGAYTAACSILEML